MGQFNSRKVDSMSNMSSKGVHYSRSTTGWLKTVFDLSFLTESDLDRHLSIRFESKSCTIVAQYCTIPFLTCSLDQVKNRFVFNLLWTNVKNEMSKTTVFDLYRDMVGQKQECQKRPFLTFHLFLTYYSERPKGTPKIYRKS